VPVEDRAPVAEQQITVTGTVQQRAWRDRVLPPVEQVRPGIWSVPTPFPRSPLRYVLAYLIETEVVAVEVRDEDRRDVGYPVAGRSDACHQTIPCLATRPARVDKHRAALRLDEVGEDVTQRAVRERRRHGPDPRPDLLNRRKDAVAPSPLLHGPGNGDLLFRHGRAVFNGH
jgi:hypothetical protein